MWSRATGRWKNRCAKRLSGFEFCQRRRRILLLRRFQAGMNESLDQKLGESQEKVRAEFEALWESWRNMNTEQQAELRNGFHKLGDEAVGEFRGRLENISNSWMVATVTTLNHQSREVIAKIAATAEERLREASAGVFAKFS